MINNESGIAKIDYSSLVVRTIKMIPLGLARETWNQVSVVVTALTGGTLFPNEGKEVNLSSFDFTGYLTEEEKNEVPRIDTVARFFSIAADTDIATMIEYAEMYGDSIVFLSAASKTWLETSVKPNHKMVTWLTAADESVSEAEIDFAGKSMQGVMLDKKREGKLLYALLNLLSRSDSVYHTHQIINNGFSGLTTKGDAKQAEDYKLSYWFNSRQQVFPDGFFVGGQQAFKIYYDLLIAQRLVDATASYIQQGRVIGELIGLQNAMHSVGAAFRANLNPDITNFTVPLLGELTDAQRVTGTIPITAQYEVLGEVRRVELTIKEAA